MHHFESHGIKTTRTQGRHFLKTSFYFFFTVNVREFSIRQSCSKRFVCFVFYLFSNVPLRSSTQPLSNCPPPSSTTTCNGINKTPRGTYVKQNWYDLQKPQSPVWYNGTAGGKLKIAFLKQGNLEGGWGGEMTLCTFFTLCCSVAQAITRTSPEICTGCSWQPLPPHFLGDATLCAKFCG